MNSLTVKKNLAFNLEEISWLRYRSYDNWAMVDSEALGIAWARGWLGYGG